MTTLRDCTRTRLTTVVNPGFNFLVDPDLEHHYRALARKVEAVRNLLLSWHGNGESVRQAAQIVAAVDKGRAALSKERP